ncbi:hypothetical protein [Mucilaginibacter sp. OK283]|jgi:hypothetical protein|uniref:hypothetical protein n=1 Tax=Mucilaginibacter sp. OK283 TaxID=1881049 RepID=UPI0008CA3139|nr:hypothetical protein [Mucilaginibacter sp. OK283]SEP46075.1 hypothetical protein SAMN05428947_1251 [Mucilaginibacter sp. OK283]
MDEFKISLFENEHNASFPQHRELTKLESQKLANEISKKYNINILNFEMDLAAKQSFYNESDSLENFKLIDNLKKIGITPMKEVFINWYRFERIDVFNAVDLDKFFYNIWFPSSDDIDIFDESLNWIVSIRHDGIISYIIENK